MRLCPGHVDGDRTVHLTHTTLVHEALCGAVVDCDGEPAGGTLCLDCLEHAALVVQADQALRPPLEPAPPAPLPLAA